MSGPDSEQMEEANTSVNFEGEETIYYEASSHDSDTAEDGGIGYTFPSSAQVPMPPPDQRNRKLSTPATVTTAKNQPSTAISSSTFPSTASLPFDVHGSQQPLSFTTTLPIVALQSSASGSDSISHRQNGLESIQDLLSLDWRDELITPSQINAGRLIKRSQERRERSRQVRERANRKSSLSGVDGYSVDLISFMEPTNSVKADIGEGSTATSIATTARTSLRPASTSPPIRPRRRRPVASPIDITTGTSSISSFAFPSSPNRLSFPSDQVDTMLKSTTGGNLAPSPVIISKSKDRNGPGKIYTRSSIPAINTIFTSPFPSRLEAQAENLPPTSPPVANTANDRPGKVKKANSTNSLRKVAKSIFRMPASLSPHADFSATVEPNTGRLAPSPRLSISSSFSTLPKLPLVSIKTWRSTLSIERYKELLALHGRSEMKRQEVIHELITTERSFVEGLQSILSIFVLPLRSTMSSTTESWITGIPIPITRLFDWLEDIVHLHSEILRALESLRSNSSSVILDLASTLLPFLSELEVYQPYLVRLEAVTNAIDSMTKDIDSDFGEFLRRRMRSHEVECGALSLGSWLLKPVQRLMKYPLFFKQLCLLTPLSHSDYAAVNSLLKSTEFLLHSMQEVKARSDEFEELMTLEEHIQGLPENFRLASRDRRILDRGALNRVLLSNKDQQTLQSAETTDIPQSPAPSTTATLTPASTEPSSPIFSPRPNSEVSVFSQSSQESIAGSLYYSSENSTGTIPTSDYNSSPPTPESSSITKGSSARHHLLSMKSLLDFSTSHYLRSTNEDGIETNKVEPISSLRSKTVPRVNRGKVLKTKAKETELTVFIFSDLVLFTSKMNEAGTPYRYQVLEGMGLSKLETLMDLSGKTEHDFLLHLSLLPSNSSQTDQPSTSIYLTLPHSTASPEIKSKQANAWLSSLRRNIVLSSHAPSTTSSPAAQLPRPRALSINVPITSIEHKEDGHQIDLKFPAMFDLTCRSDPGKDDAGSSSERVESEWWNSQLIRVQEGVLGTGME